jgi:hypothetical protein
MDVLLGTEVQQLLLVKSRVELNLKSSRANAAVIQDMLDLGNVEVGKTCQVESANGSFKIIR